MKFKPQSELDNGGRETCSFALREGFKKKRGEHIFFAFLDDSDHV